MTGRFVNNGWLQECPDPITRLTWDNAILISPRLAKELGVDPWAKAQLFSRRLRDASSPTSKRPGERFRR